MNAYFKDRAGRRWFGAAVIVIGLVLVAALSSSAASGDLLIDSGQRLGNDPVADSALGDLDGDGDLDVFLANNNAPMQVWFGDNTGTFSDSGQRLGGSAVIAMGLGDVDGDDDLDAVIGNGYEQASQVWLNNGSGQFSDSGERLGGWSPPSHIIDLALGDIDGDADLDIFMSNGSYYGAVDLVFLNDGAGHFTDSGQRIGWGNNTGAVAFGDVDADGDLDAFVGKCGNYTKVWLNDGLGVFTDSGQQLRADCAQEVLLVDFDIDGDLDAFVANGHSSENADTFYLNNGNGVFSDSGQLLGQDLSYGAAAGDLNHDGFPDVVTTSLSWDNPGQVPSRVYVNDGAGNFTLAQSLNAYDTMSVSLADLNADGNLDAFFGGFRWTSVDAPSMVWLGSGPPTSTLTIEKIAGDAETFHFTSDIPGHEVFSLTTEPGEEARVTWQVPAGEYAISEAPIHGWELASATCDNGDTPGALTLEPGASVTCTFRNNGLPGHLTIVKETDNPSDQVFHFVSSCPGLEAFDLVDNGTPGADRLRVEITEWSCSDLSEEVPAGWELTSATCDDGQNPQENIDIGLGDDITCTFHNEIDRGSLTLLKQTNPPGGTGFPFTLQPAFLFKWGGSGTGDGRFDEAYAIAVAPGGAVYVADFLNDRIQKFDETGTFQLAWGSHGSGDGQFARPSGLTVGNDGNVYVADTQNHRIQKFDANGNHLATWGGIEGNGNGQFRYPYDVATDGNNDVYVADFGNARIQKFDTAGTYITQWGSSGSGDGQFIGTVGVEVGGGRVYVTDYHNHRVQVFSETGVFQTKWGSQGTGDGQFNHPWGIGLDSAGHVYVTDEQNQRVQVFDETGGFLAKWGGPGTDNGQFNGPLGIALGSNGLAYIADTLNNRVQVFSPPQWAMLNDGQQDTFAELFPGTYSVSERLPVGWELASATCDNGDTPDTVAIDPGASVTCTFTNDKANTPPVTVDDSYITNPGQTLTVGAPGVLGNDTDTDGNPLTAVLVSGPQYGQLTLNLNGSFTYIPRLGFVGTDAFSYKANDGTATSNWAMVNIVVDSAPVARGDTYSGRRDTPLVINSPGVLANDYDLDGSAMYARLVDNPSHGTVTLQSNGYLQYMPNNGFTGEDKFTYRASDWQQLLYSNTVEVRISIVGLPSPQDDEFWLGEDQSLIVYSPGVLGNDISPSGSQLHVYEHTAPQHGSIALYDNGYIYYHPDFDYFGWDRFDYRVSDGVVVSPYWATVWLHIDPVDDPPWASNDFYRTPKHHYLLPPEVFGDLNVSSPGVLLNDIDIDTPIWFLNTRLRYSPSRAIGFAFGSRGDFWYRPTVGFSGNDFFEYDVWDGWHWSPNVGGVTIEVYDTVKTKSSDPTSYAMTEQSAAPLASTAENQQSILISGGYSGGQPSQSNISYNTSTGESSQAAQLPEARASQSAYNVTQSKNSQWRANVPVELSLVQVPEIEDQPAADEQDFIILIGGVGVDDQPLASTVLYDPLADAWIDGPNMSEPRTGFGSAQAANGSIVIAGGFNGSAPTASVDHYDPAAGTMPPLASMNQPRMDFQLVRLTTLDGVEGEYFLAIGGRDESAAYLPAVEVYNPAAGTWMATGSLNIARAGHTATTLLDGRVLITGGETGGGPTATAEIFDPATGQWSLTGSLTAPLVGHTATLLPDGSVLVIGDNGGESLMEVYSPDTGEWYPTANGQVGRQNHTATLLDSGQVVIIGGTVSDGAMAAATLNGGESTASETDMVEVYLIPPEAYLTITKETDPADSEAAFEFTSNMPDAATFSLDGGDDNDAIPTQIRFGPLIPGQFTVTELATERYDQAVRCDNGVQGTDSVTLNLAGGEDVTCTFTNSLINTPPQADDDLIETDEDMTISFDVLTNDLDAENDPMVAELISEALYGTLVKTGEGTFIFTPAADWFGDDSFAYQVCDSHDPAVCDTAIVTITVAPLNDPPVAVDDLLAVTAGMTAEIDLLGNDKDIDSGALSVVIVTDPTHGMLVVETGSVAYTPEDGFVGVDSFTYRLDDGAVGSNIATVTISVYGFTGFFPPVDNPPTLNTVKAGRAVPVKFSLGGDFGLDILATGYPKSVKIACDSGVPIDTIEETVTAGNSNLQYNPATGQYTYVWKTQKAWSNTCRQFQLMLADGSLHVANFKFK